MADCLAFDNTEESEPQALATKAEVPAVLTWSGAESNDAVIGNIANRAERPSQQSLRFQRIQNM